ncbi:sulfate transporter CysZ [Legionella micdadei]|uniref:sulfate transporter CysZ n=1 Tax=Legionella micdadei TaxID=451 RepID=UPI0009EF735F|nr:sulfate transporter CysZ [Legionella micdadei]ARG97566.1 sulfate transporter CysZ [Legionella micdadei]NSL17628.1 sulfate transporter CysZ [Legionella micdadei]
MLGEFIRGTRYFLLGLSRLKTKGLRRFILLPIIFNFLLFVGLFYFAYNYLLSYAQYFINLLPSWLSFLHWLFIVFFCISFLFIFLVTFTVLFNLVASPFNGLLAEKAQRLFYHSDIPSLPFLKTACRSMKRQGKFLWYFFPRFLGVTILFFIPFIHPAFPFIWFLFNSWILSIQYLDFVMDNNLVGFKEMQNKIREKRMVSLGFGCCISLVSIIPFLNLITIPAAVIGGVIFYQNEFKEI